MKINSPFIKVPLLYAAIASVVAMALVLFLFYASKHPFLIPVYADFRIFLFGVFLFFSLKEYRDRHQQGILYFWQGMVGSYVFLLAFSVCVGVCLLMLGTADATFVSEFVRLFTEQARAFPPAEIERMGKENFERNLSAVADTNAFDMVQSYVTQNFLIGFFISIIITVVLRKQPKEQ
jgi:hypothetical protein